MTVEQLYRHLLQKLTNANIDIDAYLQLRKAKGYMSVSKMTICVITCLSFAVKCMRRRRACRMPFTGGEGCPSPRPANRSPPLHYA